MLRGHSKQKMLSTDIVIPHPLGFFTSQSEEVLRVPRLGEREAMVNVHFLNHQPAGVAQSLRGLYPMNPWSLEIASKSLFGFQADRHIPMT